MRSNLKQLRGAAVQTATPHLGTYQTHEGRAISLFRREHPGKPLHGMKVFHVAHATNEVMVQLFSDKKASCYYYAGRLVPNVQGDSTPVQSRAPESWMNYAPLGNAWKKL